MIEYKALDYIAQHMTDEFWIRLPFEDRTLDPIVKVLVSMNLERVQEQDADWFYIGESGVETILIRMQQLDEDTREKVMISGSKEFKTLPDEAYLMFQSMINKGLQVLVGDDEGVDTLVQNYFKGKHPNVRVYHCGNKPRYNAGFLITVPVEGRYPVNRYEAMAAIANYGLVIWDGTGRQLKANIGRVPKTKTILVKEPAVC